MVQHFALVTLQIIPTLEARLALLALVRLLIGMHLRLVSLQVRLAPEVLITRVARVQPFVAVCFHVRLCVALLVEALAAGGTFEQLLPTVRELMFQAIAVLRKCFATNVAFVIFHLKMCFNVSL